MIPRLPGISLRFIRRVGALSATFGVVAVLVASTASAHVTITPSSATAGGYATLSFKVPNEKADASTTKLEVQFPADHPLASVSTQPVPGWTVTVQKTQLAKPITSHGRQITEVVSTITWEGGTINPGEFQMFPISVGPLPDDASTLVFKALQTYSDGDVVRWIDEPTSDGTEAEHPAPTLTLAAAAADDHGHDSAATTTTAAGSSDHDEDSATSAEHDSNDNDDDVESTRTLAVIGIAVGAIGLIAAIGALLRKPKAPPAAG